VYGTALEIERNQNYTAPKVKEWHEKIKQIFLTPSCASSPRFFATIQQIDQTQINRKNPVTGDM
jgi:hypothetical protein